MSVAVTLVARLLPTFPGRPDDAAAAIGALAVVRTFARSRTTETELVTTCGTASSPRAESPGTGAGRRGPGPPDVRFVRKRWRWPRTRDRAKGVFRTTVGAASPARREFDALLRLRALPSGPFGPEPLGVVEVRRSGVLHACTLLLEEIRGAVDLATFLGAERNAARRAAILADLADRTRDMHAAGLLDREHHPRNVLVAGGRTWKVDAWKQRVRRTPLGLETAVEDLAALDVGLVRLARPDERTGFLAHYLGARPSPAALRRLDAARARIDARESTRLPVTEVPPDNDR